MRKLFLAAVAATLIGVPAMAVGKTRAAGADAAATDAPSIKSCAARWRGFTDAEKDTYKAKAEGRTGKTGRKLSGYNVFTKECMGH